MNYVLSDRVSSLKPSLIREILKMSSAPGMIPFSAGNPAPDAFPSEEIGKITAGIFATHPVDALQYSITEGYQPLKDAIRGRYPELFHETDDVIITTGAQQVMNLATMSLCNEGDVIICENPSFIGSLNSFRSFNARLAGVKTEADGMNLNVLEDALKANPNAKFIYVIPDFQNPTGLTTSLEKRREIYNLAKRYGVMILEDNPYGETRFTGESVPTIKSMDEDGIVIYAGSFSKVIAPGLRVGYAIAPKPVLSKMTVCKQVQDVHTPILSQLIVHSFMTGDGYNDHLNRIRNIYRDKCRLMCECMADGFKDSVEFTKPNGGLFIWCRLPDEVDMLDFCKKGIERGVAVVPGTAFLTDEAEHCLSFRANFTTPTDEQIINGVSILSDITKSLISYTSKSESTSGFQ